MFHAFGPEGVFDFIYADTRRSLANAEQAVRALLDAGTVPYIPGGDHSITTATVAAYSEQPPTNIVHLDAHFDFIDERNGIHWGHGSPMRRAAEMSHVKGITTLGTRNMDAVSRKDWEAARAYGSHVASLQAVRTGVLKHHCATSPMANASTCQSTLTRSILRLHQVQQPSATAASATTK
jgi:agmatinase